MSHPSFPLVTRADDAGSCPGANAAIAEGLGAGVLKNVSIMFPCVWVEGAVAALRDWKGVDLGFHLTLTAEWDGVRWGPLAPAQKVPSLIDDEGFFFSSTRALHENGFRVAEAMVEVEAQYAAARKLGVKLAYLDYHMGVNYLPGLQEALDAFCARERIAATRPVPYLPPAHGDALPSVEVLRGRLAEWKGGPAVVVTHPVKPEPEAHRFTKDGNGPEAVLRVREAELKLWCDPALPGMLAGCGARPSRYSEIL